MYNYDIGGQEHKPDANEGISEITQNRTLLIEKLTDEEPIRPQFVSNLKTVREVFEHFKPSKEIELATEEGTTKYETLHFESLSDFGKQGIIKNSRLIGALKQQNDDIQNFLRKLKSNRALQTVLSNEDTKAAYMSALRNLINEIA